MSDEMARESVYEVTASVAAATPTSITAYTLGAERVTVFINGTSASTLDYTVTVDPGDGTFVAFKAGTINFATAVPFWKRLVIDGISDGLSTTAGAAPLGKNIKLTVTTGAGEVVTNLGLGLFISG